jgi:hypothetical protein
VRHELLYIPSNRDIPRGTVTSTARRGDKWFNLASPGDMLDLIVEGPGNEPGLVDRENIGSAVVAKVELVDYGTVLARANENHVGQLVGGANARSASELLARALTDAYRQIGLHEQFTMLHFIRVND